MINVSLLNKLAVVTGETRGIGQAIVHCLEKAGAKVIVTGTKPSKVKDDQHFYYAVDFTNETDRHEFADFLSSKQPDVLINERHI